MSDCSKYSAVNELFRCFPLCQKFQKVKWIVSPSKICRSILIKWLVTLLLFSRFHLCRDFGKGIKSLLVNPVNLVPRVSHPGGGKMRDPGNKDVGQFDWKMSLHYSSDSPLGLCLA